MKIILGEGAKGPCVSGRLPNDQGKDAQVSSLAFNGNLMFRRLPAWEIVVITTYCK